MTQTEEQKRDEARSEDQARAQLASIVEMVRNLTLEGAAQNYAEGLERPKLLELCRENDLLGEDFSEEENSDDDLRGLIVDAVTGKFGDPAKFGLEWDEEDAQRTIHEDALSVEVRTDWHSPGDSEGQKPSEFRILLCTGGPACQIIGDLSEHGEPERPRLQHQDWFTPWTELVDISSDEREALLTYCQQFYFGE